MADITLCVNEDCPIGDVCKRRTTEANPERQSYAYFSPNEDGKCEYFLQQIITAEQ